MVVLLSAVHIYHQSTPCRHQKKAMHDVNSTGIRGIAVIHHQEPSVMLLIVMINTRDGDDHYHCGVSYVS